MKVCTACLKAFKPDDYVYKLQCDHDLHARCAWQQTWHSPPLCCPGCKASVVVVDVFKHEHDPTPEPPPKKKARTLPRAPTVQHAAWAGEGPSPLQRLLAVKKPTEDKPALSFYSPRLATIAAQEEAEAIAREEADWEEACNTPEVIDLTDSDNE